jgi:tRNA-specific 2-thiouridylase
MMTAQRKHIIVGMSGGVDSSVSALLLQQQGHDVSGLFMKNWEENDPTGPCPAAIDAGDAMQVCDRLDIPFDAVNFSREYWDRVFGYFLDEYHRGRTPNPDVLCNREIKFRAFLDHALATGADQIATGHYARIRRDGDGYHLLKGLDADKDQSYFLYLLNQAQLARARFPLGELTKTEVRAIAERHGFANHAKKDSTGICFIGERRFNEFLGQYLPARPGDIRSLDGRHLGRHQGLMFHTIGQRKGLGIGGRADNPGAAWYVVDKDLTNNVLVVAQGRQHPALYARALIAERPHWIGETAPALPLHCCARIRYRQADQACTVTPLADSRLRVNFVQAQRAVSPGQSVVFYRDDECLGGAIIARSVDAGIDAAAAVDQADPHPESRRYTGS